MLDAVHVDNSAVDLAALSANEAVDLQALSDKSETSSQLDAKYEANMRSVGCPLCNWQFEICYLLIFLTMHCQFKYGCNNFAHKRCSIL